MEAFPGTATVVAIKQQVSSDLGADSVILELQNGLYYGLNEVGTTVWKLIQEPRRVSEIQERLLEQYDVDTQRCTDDLTKLLADLKKAGLIEVR